MIFKINIIQTKNYLMIFNNQNLLYNPINKSIKIINKHQGFGKNKNNCVHFSIKKIENKILNNKLCKKIKNKI